MKKLLIFILLLFLSSSCATIKKWEKSANSYPTPEMQMYKAINQYYYKGFPK